jgi:ABC-type transport system involved in multi-copper enzyme maturation permease subunit
MVNNMIPILRRELIEQLRTNKAVLLQILISVVFAILIIARWPTDSQSDLSGLASRQVLRLFGYGLLTVIALLVPSFPATTIIREKIKGTLALLFNSPIRPIGIYAGKFFGVFFIVVILLSTSLPAAGACFAMGGISLTGEIIPLYLILITASIQFIMLGLVVSTYANSTDSALRMTYGLVLLITILVLGPYQLFQSDTGTLKDVSGWIRCISPIPATMEVLGQKETGLAGFSASYSAINRYFILAGISCLFMIYLTLSRLNYRIFDRSRSAGVVTDDRTKGAKRFRNIFYLVDPQKRSKGIGDWTNPVMIKEFRCRRFGRSHWLLRLVALCIVVSILLTYFSTTNTLTWGIEAIGGLMVLLQVSLLVLITPSLSAGLISSEIESNGWQLLQSTPLSVIKILIGKLLSVAWTLSMILCATLPGYLIILFLKPEMQQQIINVLICLVIAAVFAILVSAFISSLFRQTAAATTTAYVVLLSIFGGTMLFWLGRGAPFGHEIVEKVLLINPMAAALHAGGTAGFEEYQLIPGNWYIMGLVCMALLFGLVYRTWKLSRPQ